MPGSPADSLAGRVAAELARPAPPAARALADAIRERHGGAIAGVLFYGSCLRKSTHEGVHDFYVLVDDYRTAYAGLSGARLGGRILAWSNAALPPSVFYLETDAKLEPAGEPTTVRCKYAVISCRDFERATSPACLHPYIWSRFAQPAMLVWARDDATRRVAERACEQAIVTLVQRLAPFLRVSGDQQRFSLSALWQEAFRRTYTSEFRGESGDYLRSLYQADPERYDETGRAALARLRDSGWLTDLALRANAVEITLPPARRTWARLRWNATRPLAKLVALIRLLKTAFTFGDWLPYALWKVERHSGMRPQLSERQRRHPLIFGWPVLYQLLRSRALR